LKHVCGIRAIAVLNQNESLIIAINIRSYDRKKKVVSYFCEGYGCSGGIMLKDTSI